MKRMSISQSSVGQSMLVKEMQTITNSLLLPLDLLWHTIDYSEGATEWFKEEKTKFLAENQS